MLPVPKGLRNLLPTMEELKACRFAFLNGSVVGFIIGILPGAGSTIASFISYGLEKAVSKHPEKFGTGVPEGVAAPEGANNSETGGALVPMLTLGIPGSSTTAILLAALILWGLKPGPLMIQDNPTLFWGLVASMYVGNVMLLILNIPLIPLFAQILRCRSRCSIRSSSASRSSACTASRAASSTCGCSRASACSATSCASSTIRPRRSYWGSCSATAWSARCASR